MNEQFALYKEKPMQAYCKREWSRTNKVYSNWEEFLTDAVIEINKK